MARFAERFSGARQEAGPAAVVPRPPAGEEAAGRFTLLLVDDEPGVLKALRRIFLDANYRILTADCAETALDLLAAETVQLVISDHRMPGLSGAELLRTIKERWPETIRIMLTGFADVQSIMGAVNEGAVYKFITKPWNDEDLRLTVSLALQQHLLLRENRKLREETHNQQLKLKSCSSLLSENSGFLGNLLARAGLVEHLAFQQALRDRQPHEHITEALVRLGLASESRMLKALQDALHLDFIDLREVEIARDLVHLLPHELCRKGLIIPVKVTGRDLTLAMADPCDFFKTDDLSRMSGYRILPVVGRAADIRQQLARVFDMGGEGPVEFAAVQDLEPIDEVDIIIEDEELDENVQELLSSSEVPPIIRIVNAVISEGIRYLASDIHLEPKTKYTVVRFRIDGLLHDKIKVPAELHPAIVSRIKILSKLDISERRRPQDGRITVKSGTRMVDLRVSTMPSINGEKIVMRILDKNASIKSLEELGLLPDEMKQVNGIIRRPQGIIIATGPTGSGKTTLLYSILSAMLERSRNFETIEDPVEYFLEEANQVFVREQQGLNFASVLRATLRQDPDVILVGEIRDLETADVAFKAALTGHMVLTTLHTNNSIASVTRLVDIGIKPYLIASALEGVAAQRLVRKLCRHCRVLDVPASATLELLRLGTNVFPEGVWSARGCPRCNQTGYEGRTGLYELLVMNDDYRHLICENYRESRLVEMARANGMQTLLDAGLEKVRRGQTSLDELLRVIGPQIQLERNCGRCGRNIDAKHLYCPYCGQFKQNICAECQVPLEDDWQICPFCGTRRYAEVQPPHCGERNPS